VKPKPYRRDRARPIARAVLGIGVLILAAGCTAGGTPSVAGPASTVQQTVTSVTTVRTTSTVTATETVTPTPTETLVVATFKDPSTFECTDTTAESCWALDVTTGGPCPDGVYVAIDVHRRDETEILQVLETTSAPVTDELGGRIEVQLSQTGLAPGGEDLLAELKEARCA
jgi:hypothetical protein